MFTATHRNFLSQATTLAATSAVSAASPASAGAAAADVPAAVKAAGPRLFDTHIKDLADFKSDNSGMPVGDGAMPIPGIFKALVAIGFKGQVMLEYGIDENASLPAMVKSFAYMRGVLAGMGYKA
jgi:sugar phosphate isomerase/epimerase